MWFIFAFICVVLGTVGKLEYDRKPDRYTDPKRHKFERKVCMLVVVIGIFIFIVAFASGLKAALQT